MSERKINLEEILFDKIYEDPYEGRVYIKSDILNAMKEFGKQLLELAAENAKAEIHTEWEGNTGSEYYTDYAVVNKQSILDTLNQVE